MLCHLVLEQVGEPLARGLLARREVRLLEQMLQGEESLIEEDERPRYYLSSEYPPIEKVEGR